MKNLIEKNLLFQPFLIFLSQPTIVAGFFEDFEPPSKKFLATPLLIFSKNIDDAKDICSMALP